MDKSRQVAARLNQNYARSQPVYRAKRLCQLIFASSAMSPAIFTPVGPPPIATKLSKRRRSSASSTVSARSNASNGGEEPAHPRLPLVRANASSYHGQNMPASNRGDDEKIKADEAFALLQTHTPCIRGSRSPRHGSNKPGVGLMPQNSPDWHGNIRW
jgi:hypothetical protein